ncbi:ABC transporter permease subunit [Bacillus megaterium]|nr:ABC transporter permease subunit [Priestia megaterium]
MIHQAEEKQTGLWQIFLYDKQFILSLTIPLSITLAASVIANTEHQGNAWKQLLALPIKRSSIFVGKFLLLFLAICLSGVVSYFALLAFWFVL